MLGFNMLIVVMLNTVVRSVVILKIVMMIVIMLSVIALTAKTLFQMQQECYFCSKFVSQFQIFVQKDYLV
jgi:hypothetical protein